MISYDKFKKLFDAIPGEPEFKLYFNNTDDTYWIIKYENYVTFQKSSLDLEEQKENKYSSLDELYNSTLVDDICLKNDWNKISDIVIDDSMSIIDNKDDIEDAYNINI
jgi:hypothetical protein